MLDDFLTRAALAAVGVALAAAPLGSMVVWRRMAYFGDATAHAAVLGVALALGFEAPIFVGTLMVAVAMALVVARLTGREMASDMVLGVLSHSALAFGLVAVSFVPGARLDLSSYTRFSSKPPPPHTSHLTHTSQPPHTSHLTHRFHF